MPFSERIRNLAKYRSAHRCCVCHKPFVEVHHLIPQASGGDDSLENAAPLCASCHDLYGGNPEKRKALRQLRDYWWSLMDERRANVTEAASIDDAGEITEDFHAQGALHSRGVVIYHIVFSEEDFSTAAYQIFALVRAAQESEPNKPRHLFLDIDGHRTESGAFDHDAFELQRYFLLGFMFQYLAELHMPLMSVRSDKAQINDIPESLNLIEELDKEAVNAAIDKGVEKIWVADRDKPIRLG